MISNKFEYFLNAVHYCLYKEEVWSNRKIEKRVWQVFHYVSRLFGFEKFYIRRKDINMKDNESQEYMYGKNWGQSIGLAHHWYGFFYSGYLALFSFILLGLVEKRFGDLSNALGILLIAIPTGLCYIPAYKAVFTKDRYLKFFKQFEKEDEQWHKKWKWITIAFCIGSVVTFFSGIFIGGTIAHS